MKIDDSIKKFGNAKVLVIGDIMIDQYLKGDVERISPEAPVQIVHYKETENVLGGAGNVVCNLAHLGAKVYFCGVVGDDNNKEILFNELKSINVDSNGVIADKNRRTTVKQRIVAGNRQQLLRIDYEDRSDINKKIEDKIINNILKSINNVDIIVVSDYAKGVITKRLMENLIKISKKNNKKILVDGKNVLLRAKNYHLDFFKGVDLIKPNKKEAEEMTGVINDVEKMGKVLMERLNSTVFITRGKDGVSIFEKNKDPVHIKNHVEEVYDVTGAGDTFMAVAALGLTAGLSYLDSAKLANIAAGIVVQKRGTSHLSLDELKENLKRL